MNATRTETIYIAPGNSQCRVYALPYGMREGQSPGDINHEYQAAWKEIGLMNYQLKVVCLEPAYADLKDEIAGQMGGTFFQVVRPVPRKAPEDLPVGAELVLEILRDASRAMACVQMNGAKLFEGGRWDFRPSHNRYCDESEWPQNHLAWKEYHDPDSFVAVLKDALTAEGFNVVVKNGNYRFGEA